MSRRVGVFGGSFDPIHIGHLTLARHAREACKLDELMFIPVGDPPHKAGPVARADHRLAMVSLAVIAEPNTSVSRIEMDRTGKSYTVDTLRALRQSLGDVELFLLIGTDNAVEMGSWYRPDEVLELSRVTVLCRPGWDRARVPGELAAKMTFLDSPLIDCSSTDVRERVASREPIVALVDDSVARYIDAHELYAR